MGTNGDEAMLTVSTNHQVVMDISENRSTAYEWEIIENTCQSSMKVVYDNYQFGPQQLADNGEQPEFKIGQTGKRTWILQTPTEKQVGATLKGKICFVKMISHRPWEAPVETDLQKTVQFYFE